jgi:hypothetical protein
MNMSMSMVSSTSPAISTRRTCALVVTLIFLSSCLVSSNAWIQPQTSSFRKISSIQRYRTTSTTTTRTTTSTSSRRFLSDLPRDNDKSKTNKSIKESLKHLFTWKKPKLPAPPEDLFTLTGDVMSLFVYSFSDHFVCHDCASMAVRQASHSGSSQLHAAAIDNGLAGAGNLPVWLDTTGASFTTTTVGWADWASPADAILQQQLQDHLVVQYSPILQDTGMAAVFMTAAWLVAGYLHEAFSVRHTLDCPTEQTLIKTAQTWLTACTMLLAVTAGTNYLMTTIPGAVGGGGGGLDYYISSMEQGEGVVDGFGMLLQQLFTRGDLDYILDSLSVLVLWRFMMSSMLGSGGSR